LPRYVIIAIKLKELRARKKHGGVKMDRKERQTGLKLAQEIVEGIGKYLSGKEGYSRQKKLADVKIKMDAFVAGKAEISDVIAMFSSLELKHITRHTAIAPEIYISRMVEDYKHNYLAALRG
jgi:hypothetical protein